MFNEKPWYASRTNITNIITFLATIGALFGLDLDADTQAGVVAAIVGVGAAISTLFRNKATKAIR